MRVRVQIVVDENDFGGEVGTALLQAVGGEFSAYDEFRGYPIGCCSVGNDDPNSGQGSVRKHGEGKKKKGEKRFHDVRPHSLARVPL